MKVRFGFPATTVSALLRKCVREAPATTVIEYHEMPDGSPGRRVLVLIVPMVTEQEDIVDAWYRVEEAFLLERSRRLHEDAAKT
jgi:hypothetical protein